MESIASLGALTLAARVGRAVPLEASAIVALVALLEASGVLVGLAAKLLCPAVCSRSGTLPPSDARARADRASAPLRADHDALIAMLVPTPPEALLEEIRSAPRSLSELEKAADLLRLQGGARRFGGTRARRRSRRTDACS
ncbi:MAG: hypothetical protein OZ921_03000 [Sorangiineae bacterium]|nr:hypothetical protein [Sorangiineae bacterium]